MRVLDKSSDILPVRGDGDYKHVYRGARIEKKKETNRNRRNSYCTLCKNPRHNLYRITNVQIATIVKMLYVYVPISEHLLRPWKGGLSIPYPFNYFEKYP